MSREASLEVVHRYYDAYNSGDVAAFGDLFAPGFVAHPSAGTIQPDSGARMHAEVCSWARESMPDLRYQIQDLIVDGEKVVDRVTVSGTLKRELSTRWGVLAPTGDRLHWTEITIHRFVDGRIAEQWWETDWAGLLEQVGILKQPTSE